MTVPATGVTAPSDLLRLVQVRTLAGIGDLLDADLERFAAAVADVHRRLTERVEELVARRDTLHRLACGDRVLLPDRACAPLANTGSATPSSSS